MKRKFVLSLFAAGLTLLTVAAYKAWRATREPTSRCVRNLRHRRHGMEPLTVVANIKPKEDEALREILNKIGNGRTANPYVHFPQSRTTHFARFVMLKDRDNGPRLLFTTDYDPPLKDHLEELIGLSPGLDEIWGKCEGYTGKSEFLKFVRAHSYKSRGFYVAFPDETVDSIQRKIAIRKEIEDLCDSAESLGRQRVERFVSWLSQLSEKSSRRLLLGASVSRAFFKVVHDFLLAVYLRVGEAYAQFGMEKKFSRVTADCGAPAVRDSSTAVKAGYQTSFTVFVDIKARHRLSLSLALAGTRLLALCGYPPGNFAKTYTLHAFRWVVLDDWKRLIFMSTFDGTWENYMGDFISKLVWALNALYKHTEGYPPGGMKQVYLFEQWIRDHQPQPQVVYNAYPEETVLNLISDRQICKLIGADSNPQAIRRRLELL
jgi:hypothetical protein